MERSSSPRNTWRVQFSIRLIAISVTVLCCSLGMWRIFRRAEFPIEVRTSQWPENQLHLCAYKGDVAGLVAHISRNPAEAMFKDSNGRTALHWAVFGQRVNSVTLLIRLGYDPTVQDAFGHSPLDYAKSTPLVTLLEPDPAQNDDGG
jgi:ankyrin repeat protein